MPQGDGYTQVFPDDYGIDGSTGGGLSGTESSIPMPGIPDGSAGGMKFYKPDAVATMQAAIERDMQARSMQWTNFAAEPSISTIGGYAKPNLSDGITLEEANYWYNYGDGTPLEIDINNINVNIFVEDFRYTEWEFFPKLGEVVKRKNFNLLVQNYGDKDGLVFGNIWVNLHKDGTISIDPDLYDFEYDVWWKVWRWPRNVETYFGKRVATGKYSNGNPKSFYIMIKGRKRLRHRPIHKNSKYN